MPYIKEPTVSGMAKYWSTGVVISAGFEIPADATLVLLGTDDSAGACARCADRREYGGSTVRILNPFRDEPGEARYIHTCRPGFGCRVHVPCERGNCKPGCPCSCHGGS